VIPDPDRPANKQESIKMFVELITSFDELPRIMDEAMAVIGINDTTRSDPNTRAFVKDVLSIKIKGPSRP